MVENSRRSQAAGGVEFGGLRIPSLFADDVVLLASLKSDLQLSLGSWQLSVKWGDDNQRL